MAIDVGEGGYLTFDASSQGTLFMTWSKTPVDGALAYFKPTKVVPQFKYLRSGKSELVRNIQQDHKQYNQGWCSFAKTCKQFEGSLQLLEGAGPKDVALLYNMNSNDIIRAEVGKPMDMSKVSAVACVPKDVSDFTCKTMVMNLFLEKGTSQGRAMQL